MRGLVLALFLLAASTVSATAQSVQRIEGDHGGRIGDYVDKYNTWRNSGDTVQVSGECDSACTIVLGTIPRDRICVTARATFGFHAAWDLGVNGQPVRNDAATQLLLNLYPAQVQAMLRGKQLTVGHLIRISGTRLGYRICKPQGGQRKRTELFENKVQDKNARLVRAFLFNGPRILLPRRPSKCFP